MNNNEQIGYPNSRLFERFGLVLPCSDNRGWTVHDSFTIQGRRQWCGWYSIGRTSFLSEKMAAKKHTLKRCNYKLPLSATAERQRCLLNGALPMRRDYE